MNGPFKMKPGRGDMPKTGRDIPTSMVNPIMQTTDPRSGFVAPDIDPKSGFERYQKKKVGRDAVRKRDIMDSDVGKDAFKKVINIIKREKFTKKTILFSSSAASFDSFQNFEDRGLYFNKLIKKYLNGI